MDWIKKRYDQFILLLAALALIAFGVMIMLKTGAFNETFAGALTNPPKNNTIPPLKLERIEEAKKDLEKPPVWAIGDQAHPKGSLFVSEVYVISKETQLPTKPTSDSFRKHSVTGQPIPNTWFMENGLPLTKSDVALQDPDQDGFANEDEWLGKTNPNDKESHPPYYTKLHFKQMKTIPFRLIFNSYDGDPKKPEGMTFQINTLDLRQPSEFLPIGATVSRTKFKIEKFEFKERLNDKTMEKEDVSELTVVNTENQDVVVLVLTKVTNSPDVYAIFDYVWPQPPLVFEVKRLGEFVLRPETDKRYKLIDIKPTEAVIQLPSGDKYTVRPDPRKVGK